MKSEKVILLQNLETKCKNCASCELHKTHNNIVFADGNPQTASIVLIGEAPGKDEDRQGIPFVGRAGKLLNEYLQKSGISRENDLYIINTVKCRPFITLSNGKLKDRKPTKEEKKTCRQFLLEQIKIISPKLIILCGSTSMDEFLSGEKITDAHGKVFQIEIGNKIYNAMPILHPSPLCRFEDKKNVMIKDLSIAKSLIR